MFYPPEVVIIALRRLEGFQPSAGTGGFLLDAERLIAPHLANPPFVIRFDVQPRLLPDAA